MINFNNHFSFLLHFSQFFLVHESEIDLGYEDISEFDSVSIFSVLALKFISIIYMLLKFYKILCYSKMTLDWFPIINPYEWPFSLLQTISNPYFKFWASVLPSLKFKKSSIQIAGIVGLEALNALIYICVRLANILVTLLEQNHQA